MGKRGQSWGFGPEDIHPRRGRRTTPFAGNIGISSRRWARSRCCTLIKADAGREPLIAKLPGIHRGVRGNNMRMTADPSKLHLFADGQSLLYR